MLYFFFAAIGLSEFLCLHDRCPVDAFRAVRGRWLIVMASILQGFILKLFNSIHIFSIVWNLRHLSDVSLLDREEFIRLNCSILFLFSTNFSPHDRRVGAFYDLDPRLLCTSIPNIVRWCCSVIFHSQYPSLDNRTMIFHMRHDARTMKPSIICKYTILEQGNFEIFCLLLRWVFWWFLLLLFDGHIFVLFLRGICFYIHFYAL